MPVKFVLNYLKILLTIGLIGFAVGLLFNLLTVWIVLMFWAYSIPGSVFLKLAVAGFIAILPLVIVSIIAEWYS